MFNRINQFWKLCGIGSSQITFKCPQIKPNNVQLPRLNLSTNYSENVDTLIEKLRTSLNMFHRVNERDLRTLIFTLKEQDVYVSKYGTTLLKCCGILLPQVPRHRRQILLQYFWDKLCSNPSNLTIDHCNAFIQTSIENGFPPNFKEMTINCLKCTPNEATYGLIYTALMETGDLIDMLGVNKHKSISNMKLTSLLAMAHAQKGDMVNAQSTVQLMRASKMELDSNLYIYLLRAYAKQGSLQKMQTVFQSAKFDDIKFSLREMLTVFEAIGINELYHFAGEVMAQVRSWLDIDILMAHNLCIHLVCMGYPNAAYEIFKVLPDLRINKHAFYGKFLLDEMVSANVPMDIITMAIRDLIKTNKNKHAFECTLETCLIIGDVSKSIYLMEQMSANGNEVRQHYFWPLLVKKRNSEQDIWEVIKAMVAINIKPCEMTLIDYCLPYMDSSNIFMIVRKLHDIGLNMKDFITSLIIRLVIDHKIPTALSIAKTFRKSLDVKKIEEILNGNCDIEKKSELNFTIIIATVDSTKDWAGIYLFKIIKESIEDQSYLKVLKEYTKNGITISSDYANLIKDELTFLNNVYKEQVLVLLDKCVDHKKQAKYIDDQQSTRTVVSTASQLECDYIELKSKDMNTRGALRKLIMEYVRTGEFCKAESYYNVFLDSKFKASLGLKAAALTMFIKLGKVDDAKKLFNDLVGQDGFKLDLFKVIDFCTLLIKNHHLDEAIRILEVEIKKSDTKLAQTMQRNCFELLEAIAVHNSYDDLKIVLNLLLDSKTIAPTNRVLELPVHYHLKRNKTREACQEMIELSELYKKLPCLHEIYCLLINSDEDKDLFNEIRNLTRRFYGNSAESLETIFSLAAIKQTQKLNAVLKSLYSENESILNDQYFRYKCKISEIKCDEECLLILLKSSQTVNIIPIEPIVTSLLNIYELRGNVNSARDLLAKLEDWNVPISQKMLKQFTTIVKKSISN